MKTAFLSICTEPYLNQYNILYKSLQTHCPDEAKFLYIVGESKNHGPEYDEIVYLPNFFEDRPQYPDKCQAICSFRAKAVLNLFNMGYESVIFLGADVEFFQRPKEMLGALKTSNVVVIPHILKPLPDDGKFPSNEGVEKTGQINSDVIGWKNTKATKEFLEWQDKMMQTKCIANEDIFYDQTWLQFIPFFLSNVCILRHPGYNCAYFNLHERNLKKTQRPTKDSVAKWTVRDGLPLVCFQYTGFDVDKISIHQNRLTPNDDLNELLMRYAQRL
jgi:hypothetical protein